MKKVFFLSAIAALALSSCSSDETLQAPVQNDGNAIAFDIYTARATNRAVSDATLRKSDRQNITTEVLKASKDGFGVFAYETGAQKFQSYLANNTYPTYMFNQQVQWDATAAAVGGGVGAWVYTPVKYWPNDDSFVTFQAYAPWKASTEDVLFDVKYNGVGIRYALDLDWDKIRTNNYDLLWGEKQGTEMCFANQQKPGVADKTMFHFKHALSKVDFTISYNADDMDCTTPNGLLDENTEIVIRSIKLLGTIPSQGVLSLYDGSWTVEKVSENKFEFDTDFFGYKNGFGTQDKTIMDPVPAATEAVPHGVLTKDVNKLYANSSVMLIPAETPVKLEISYDVVTKDVVDADGKLVSKGHTKNITIVSTDIPTHWGDTHKTDAPADNAGNGEGLFTFGAGMHTKIDIHLGMTSVKLDAVVEKWTTDESGAIDMPANAETPVAGPVLGHNVTANSEGVAMTGTPVPYYTCVKNPLMPEDNMVYCVSGVWKKYVPADGATAAHFVPIPVTQVTGFAAGTSELVYPGGGQVTTAGYYLTVDTAERWLFDVQ